MERFTLLTVLCILSVVITSTNASATDDKFLTSCLKYFYRNTAPTGFPTSAAHRYVCQRYEGSFYFATFYDTRNRIPLYSAYVVESLSCEGSQPSRRDQWYIEPELAGREKAADMETDQKGNRDWVMPVQAINEDYSDTGFDRGHLNPNFMHCGSGRVATFSLTNSVPQDPCFNRITWYAIEAKTKDRFEEECAFVGANRYVMTGAVPSKDEFIPQKDIIVDDQPDKATERVNVPAYSWTLACCDASESTKGNKSYFSGVIGENRAGGKVEEFTDVTAMETRLTTLYASGTNIKLLADGCGSVTSSKNTVVG